MKNTKQRGAAIAKIILALFAVGVLAAVSYGYVKSRIKDELDITHLERCFVERGDMMVSLLQGGEIDAKRNLVVKNEMRRSATIVSIVEDGTLVGKGELLVELDTQSLQDNLLQDQSSATNIEASVSQLEREMEISALKYKADRASAELQLKLAKLALEKYTSATFQQDWTKAHQAIQIAQEELRRSQDKHEWSQKLFEKGYTTRLEVDANEFEVKRRKLELENKFEDLRILEEYTKATTVAELTNRVHDAESDLQRMIKSYESGLARDEANLSARRRQLEMSRQQLRITEQELANSRIYAETDGVVFYPPADYRRSDRAIEKGASVYPGQPILRYPDLSAWVIRTGVPEAVIDSVRTGQKAIATLDALPGATIEAVVGKISVVPDQARRYDTTAKVYTVELDISTQTLVSLKPGMSAKVQIVTDVLTDVLKVPIQSVTSRDGIQYVYAVEGKTAVPKMVTPGKSNEAFVEIKAGLKERAELLLFAPVDKSTKSNLDERPIDVRKEGNGKTDSQIVEEARPSEDAGAIGPDEERGRRPGNMGERSGGGPGETSEPGLPGSGPRKSKRRPGGEGGEVVSPGGGGAIEAAGGPESGGGSGR